MSVLLETTQSLVNLKYLRVCGTTKTGQEMPTLQKQIKRRQGSDKLSTKDYFNFVVLLITR